MNVRSLFLTAAIGAVGLLGVGCHPHTHEVDKGTPPPAKKEVAAPPVRSGRVSSWVAYPTGDRDTSVLVIEKSAPAEVGLGQSFEQEIIATNQSSQAIRDVVVKDSLSEGYKFEGATPDATNNAGGVVTWNVGTLAGHESKKIIVRGSATKVGSVSDCASGTYNQEACIAVRVTEAKLALTSTAPAEVLKCDPINVTYTVTNNGTGPARNVVINHAIPDGLKRAGGGDALQAKVDTLGAGESRSFSSVLTPSKTGKFDNPVTATADGGLKAEAATSTVVKEPVLTIKKSGPENLVLGRNATYEIVVTNTGDAPAKDTIVEDTVSGGSVASASTGGTVAGNRVTWNLGTLAPKDSKTVSVTLTGGAGTLSDTASARAYCAAAVTATAQTAVKGVPAILLEVVDDPDPIEVGKTTTYTITVTNQGTAQDTGIKVVVTLEDVMEYVSSSGVTNGTVAGKTITFAPLATLPAKAVATWKVVVKATGTADTRFKATLTTDELKRPVEETEATNFYK